MILEDLATPVESIDRTQLNELLAELCELLVAAAKKDNDFFELIAAGVLDPSNRFVIGINFKHRRGKRVHAERAAIERYKKLFGPIPSGSIIVTTLSPCNRPMAGRYGESCVDLIKDEGIKYVYCGYKDPTQDSDLSVETDNPQLKTLCRAFTETFLDPDHIDEDQEEYAGIVIDYDLKSDGKYFYVRALSGDGNKELGSVDFTNVGDGWEGDHLWVDERYRGQGIATAMYDFAKEKLGKIVPSGDRTDAGLAFWKGKQVWEDKQPSKAQEFIKKVYDQYPDWPYGQADKVMVWGEGEDQQFAAFKLKPGVAADTVEIDWIMAGPEQRKGIGSRAIKELQRQAQESGIKLTLYPWAKGNVSQASLTKLYKRHGFKPIAKGAKPMAWEPDLDEGWRDVALGAATVGALAVGGGDAIKNQFYSAPNTDTEISQSVEPPPKSVPDNELYRTLKSQATKSGIKGTELAQFMAQCAHETANFTTLKEFGGKRDFAKYDPKTNPRKAKRLGNTQVGDGAKYRGRGYIQLTGRENYRRAGNALGLPLEQNPELAEKPEIAAKIAVWYWQNRVQPKVSDYTDTHTTTKPINPGLKGIEDRKEKFRFYQVKYL